MIICLVVFLAVWLITITLVVARLVYDVILITDILEQINKSLRIVSEVMNVKCFENH